MLWKTVRSNQCVSSAVLVLLAVSVELMQNNLLELLDGFQVKSALTAAVGDATPQRDTTGRGTELRQRRSHNG